MGSSDDDFSKEEMELRPIKKVPWIGVLEDLDMFAKEWGWEMLLPFKYDHDWSDYCNYLVEYYKHHHRVITEVTGSSLVDAAKTCLEKEGELVSLWDSAMKECTVEILPIKTIILSSLIIQEFADKVKCSRKALSDVSTAALLCITKEADLICKMLSVGAKPSDYTIIQSTKIRMCALSLTSHQLCGSVPAAAAMLGIMNEADKICNWIRDNGKAFKLSDKSLDYDFELGRQARQGSLEVMVCLLRNSRIPASAAAEQKPAEEKYFSGNIPRNDENYIAPAEAANSTGGSTQDQENIISTNSRKKRMEDADKEGSDQAAFEKPWVWDRLLPLKSSTEWSDYCNYLRQYYKRNASVVAEVTGSMVASAEVYLKKEEELASLWKTQVLPNPIVILPVITIAQSILIQEHAHSFKFKHARSFKFSENGGLPVASTVAFACISKEADLICELLKHGAKLTDAIIQQSIMIRMCALSLMHLQGSSAIDAAAAMVGITKECKLMCDWIKKEDKLITFSIFTQHEPLECRFIRARTLDVMLSILKESSFPSSKMWLDLVSN